MSVFNKGIVSKVLASAGSFLLMLSGQSQATSGDAKDVAKNSSSDNLHHSEENDRQHGSIAPDGRRVTVDEVEFDGQIQLAAHVNSGPTTHTNVPGHADFTSQMKPGELQSQPGAIQQRPNVARPGSAAAAHVNSGPTTHTNVPGHADFTSQMKPGERQINPGSVQQQPNVVRPGSAAASHVNSGPTTHTNVPNHADFTRQMNPGEIKMKDPVNR